MTMKTELHIYRVAFPEPPIEGDPRTDFFFTSLAAIYDLFTPGQVGCGVKRLWSLHVSDGFVYDGGKARVSVEPLYRKAQSNPNRKARRTAPETPETANGEDRR